MVREQNVQGTQGVGRRNVLERLWVQHACPLATHTWTNTHTDTSSSSHRVRRNRPCWRRAETYTRVAAILRNGSLSSSERGHLRPASPSDSVTASMIPYLMTSLDLQSIRPFQSSYSPASPCPLPIPHNPPSASEAISFFASSSSPSSAASSFLPQLEDGLCHWLMV